MSRSIFALRFKETVGATPNGVPDTAANAAGRRQAEEFRRLYFHNRLIARLRFRKRLRKAFKRVILLNAIPLDDCVFSSR
jgi:hypothetical protein